MNMDQYTAPAAESGAAGVAKLVTVWAGVLLGKAGIHAWSDVAAFMAAFYSGLLIAGWFWRRWARWRAGKPVPIDADTDRGDL